MIPASTPHVNKAYPPHPIRLSQCLEHIFFLDDSSLMGGHCLGAVTRAVTVMAMQYCVNRHCCSTVLTETATKEEARR